jgi:hypothetical protein
MRQGAGVETGHYLMPHLSPNYNRPSGEPGFSARPRTRRNAQFAQTSPLGGRRADNAMVKAIARALRWRKLLETGVYGTVGEIAAAENINASYIARILRLEHDCLMRKRSLSL